MSLNENNEEVKVNSTIFEPVATDLRKNHTYSKVKNKFLFLRYFVVITTFYLFFVEIYITEIRDKLSKV